MSKIIAKNNSVTIAHCSTQTHECSKLLNYWKGMHAIVPLTIGAIPFAMLYGAIASELGITLLATTAMSILTFAGSAQFMALGMLAVGGTPSLIIATSVIVNLRHLLYSAWLTPYLAPLSISWRALLSFGLSDEVFAVMSRHYKEEQSRHSHWFFLGATSTLWFFWSMASAAGHILGSQIQGINEAGLEIAMPVTFGTMVTLMIKDRATLLATITTCICAYLGRNLPHQLGFILATSMGIACGYFISLYKQKAKVKK